MLRASQVAELQAFLAIAEARSFRRAADRLGLRASTFSHALRALEERLGVQLLARTTRTVAPTETGAALLRSLGPAFVAVEEAVEGVNAFRDRPRGRLRLSVPRPAATQVLQPRLAAFAEAFPGVTLEVVVDDRLVDIVREAFDSGIRLGESVARDGVGLAMVSEADAGPDLAAGRLRRVLEDWCPPEFGFLLYHPRSRQPSASLCALIGALALPPQAASP